jgi:hypothetical protein
MSVRRLSCTLLVIGVLLVGIPAAAEAYNPITPTKANQTITLNGKNMTVQDLVDIARYGAKVRVAPALRQSAARNLELVLEGARQGVPIVRVHEGEPGVHLLGRGRAGAQRRHGALPHDSRAEEGTAAPQIAQRECERARRKAWTGGVETPLTQGKG